jgi:hypothetical protein
LNFFAKPKRMIGDVTRAARRVISYFKHVTKKKRGMYHVISSS